MNGSENLFTLWIPISDHKIDIRSRFSKWCKLHFLSLYAGLYPKAWGASRNECPSLYIYTRWPTEKVFLRLSWITLNIEQLESKLNMIQKAKRWTANISKNQIVLKSINGKNRACLTRHTKWVRPFSNKRYSNVCNFANIFAMRPNKGLKFVKWSFQCLIIDFMLLVH